MLRQVLEQIAQLRACGVEAGKHEQFPRWQTGYWWQKYWTDKWDVEQAVRQAAFPRWTVLKPAFMMDNFAQPKSNFMFPHLRRGEMPREEGLSVVRSLRRTDPMPDRVAEVILDKAEGNPFFLEELSRVVESGDETSAPPAVPDTIQEVLLARIDRLADEPRRLLQTAAVVGQEVPLPLLQAVWGGELDAHLRELMRLEFLHARAGGAEPVCAFTHSLTREVAYESLPLGRRRVLHGAVARALEAIHADRLGEAYDRLAHHYARTDEAAKALLYLTRLADKAVAAHAHTEAVRILEEARAHVDRLPPAEQDRRRLELALRQAYSLVPLGAFQSLATLLLHHQVTLESLNDPKLAGSYHLLLGRSYLFLGDQRQASHRWW